MYALVTVDFAWRGPDPVTVATSGEAIQLQMKSNGRRMPCLGVRREGDPAGAGAVAGSPGQVVRIGLDKDIPSSPSHTLLFEVPYDAGRCDLLVGGADSVPVRIPPPGPALRAGGELAKVLPGTWVRLFEGAFLPHYDSPIIQAVRARSGHDLVITLPQRNGRFGLKSEKLDLIGEAAPANGDHASGKLRQGGREVDCDLRPVRGGQVLVVYFGKKPGFQFSYQQAAEKQESIFDF
jgi:hypothetical protein